MRFVEAVSTATTKRYADFTGRSSRSEYWWFVLFALLLNLLLSMIGVDIISNLVALALLVPSIAVGIRRFHDIDKSGWWILIYLIPIVNFILVLVWFTRIGTKGANQFGEDPLENS